MSLDFGKDHLNGVGNAALGGTEHYVPLALELQGTVRLGIECGDCRKQCLLYFQITSFCQLQECLLVFC